MSKSFDSSALSNEGDVRKPNEEALDVPDSPAAMRELLATFTSISASGPMHHPIFAKFEREHVTQFLDHAHESDTKESRFRSSSRWFRLGYVLIGVAIFVFLTVFLIPGQSALYFEILKGIGIFAAGVGGGYGVKAYQDRGRGR